MKKGFVAITSVLVISAVSLSIVATVMLLGVGELLGSFAGVQSSGNLAFVEGCAEDALIKIHTNSTWTGGSITRPEGTCTVVVNSSNPNWDITVTSGTGDYQRKIQVKATRGTSLTVTSWEEI